MAFWGKKTDFVQKRGRKRKHSDDIPVNRTSRSRRSSTVRGSAPATPGPTPKKKTAAKLLPGRKKATKKVHNLSASVKSGQPHAKKTRDKMN